MYITWIGQSGYILTDGITEICIDPYLSNVVDRIAHRGRMIEAPIAPEELNSDIVVCTHNHLDHVDPETLKYYLTDEGCVTVLAPASAWEEVRKFGGNVLEVMSGKLK